MRRDVLNLTRWQTSSFPSQSRRLIDAWLRRHLARRLAPEIIPAQVADRLPETLRYRLKNRILGPPIATERQSTERLGRPTALAVLSSDVISSSAYATEQILFVLVRAVGIAAFSLVMPITIAVIAVLIFVTLSYLEVVKVYTKAGGAYVVSRENFGPRVAQVAVMSLLIDYTLTVAVSVAAGVAALTSVFPALTPTTARCGSPAGLVILIAYVNLRGVREAGRVFALPDLLLRGQHGDPHRLRRGEGDQRDASRALARRSPGVCRDRPPGQRACSSGPRCSW